ncbi:hypothetical protein FMUND_13676 [Fusarium mundagurra]|uniref:Uncharacterized protein n=1 Tax=Fusarium mundagurra TaxID=1567541 RepID=A0A8H5XZ30_9HYPO|nr:hypothetical protein FMUND_13676 [Fusarium mundagurra]
MNVNINCCCHDRCSCSGHGASGGESGKPPGRPTHQTGTSDDSLSKGVGTPGAIIDITTRPPNVWPGPRSKLYLPFLLIRANEGDLGARPLSGTFWESLDIIILPGVSATDAPARPPKNAQLGGVAQANKPNTLYVHVWNMGLAAAQEAIVEFYWFNPCLGFDSKNANLIARQVVILTPRGSHPSHRIVKCPVSWFPKFLNGGHECLLVRLFDPCSDPLNGPEWDARQNRHIGQRNIHVMTAAEAGMVGLAADGAVTPTAPTLGINVGPLFGGSAQVAVERAETESMPWLQLVTMQRKVVPQTGSAIGDVGITPPVPSGANLPNLGAIPNPGTVGLIGNSHGVSRDDQKVGFVTKDGNPGEGKAHVYRVIGIQDGQKFGGYTVVVLGD